MSIKPTLSSLLTELYKLQNLVHTFWTDSTDIFESVSLQITTISELQNKTEENASLYMSELMDSIIQIMKEICERHRYLHLYISHFGRTISRCFPRSEDPIFLKRVLDTDKKMAGIEEMIAYNLIINGYSDVAIKLIEHFSDVELKRNLLSIANDFNIWNTITDLIKQDNIHPALEWIKKIRKNPEQYKIVSSVNECCEIDYLLNEALFVSYIARGNRKKAVEHARSKLCKIATKLNMEDRLCIVMTCLLCDLVDYKTSGDSGYYQYNRYFSIDYRLSICFELSKWLNKICGVDVNSPLETCLTHGRMGIADVIQMVDSLKEISDKTGVDFVTDRELPVPLQINDKFTAKGTRYQHVDGYHSRFVCPILKVQSTEENPPLRLRCGHVISKDAMEKIVVNNRLKCPYCSSEQNPMDVIQVFF